ncbi:MAG: hypothetical protein KY464_15850, partial [Gemmatimonadetes bacterium]|nr:hypothetical protein [Gemmatimonadota bacterium]
NYFVTYELRTRFETSDYARAEKSIRGIDRDAVRVLYTTWHVKTTNGLAAVRDAVASALHPDDGLLVVRAENATAQHPCVGHGIQSWLDGRRDGHLLSS